MKGEITEVVEKYSSTTMSDFFRSGSVEEKRAVYRSAADTAITMQKAVISLAKEKKAKELFDN
ncbi:MULTISPECIES: hypothetical protein [Pseudomonas]|jgi:hypothetical protein|uniref:Uncharacterized protein n=2 Tax=Pseudomonas fluorescens group TaxID=136843 RepID=A0A9X9FZ19_PSEMA|nr:MULTISPECIES: hypothetical protein [Pseudomonas]MCP1464619.1 hypothetical protein [Pseudomonas sp. S3E17]MDT9633894.1 hypothetical protein [Pseudomonas sp. JV449]OCW21951.1 hypothetical protein BB029_19945 [Pseudomonas sp. S3E12]QDG56145.1 hypothetical protein NIBR502773_06310 [Pseudomonas sp. NIBRBAC000502773]RDS90874.1 hypothetical protein DL347_12550 [Pseudomonas fluorescens]